MKKLIYAVPIFLLSIFGCNQPPLIMQSQYTFTLAGEVGTSGSANFDTFESTASGTKTVLTFSNSDADVIQFQISDFKTGTFTVGSSLIVTGTLNVNDTNGQIVPVEYQNGSSGFINIDGISGSGANITGLTGSFKVNIQTGDGTSSGGGTGVIQGTFNFNNSTS